jgi:glutamyl-tRNA reductase
MTADEEKLVVTNTILIENISKKCEEIRKRELNRAARIMVAKSGTENYIRVEQLTIVLVDALLNPPLQNLKNELLSYERNNEMLDVIKKIFYYAQN